MKTMKINKEFIPLILSGEKIYEIRKYKWYEGVYIINGELYELTRIAKKWGFTYNGDTCGCEASFTKDNIKDAMYMFDIATINFLQNNNIKYLDRDIKYYVYRWEKFTPKKLEITNLL